MDFDKPEVFLREYLLSTSDTKAQAVLANLSSVGTAQEIFDVFRLIANPLSWRIVAAWSPRTFLLRMVRLRKLLRWSIYLRLEAFRVGRVLFNDGHVRRELRPGMFVYDIGNSSAAILIFTGLANRPMVPTSIFLEAIKRPDLAKVFVHPNAGYRKGIQGVATTLDSCITQIPAILREEGLEVDWVVGTSAGGLPALMYSLVHGTKRTWILGANNPKVSSLGVDLLHLSAQAGMGFRREGLVIFAGEKCTQDIVAGFEISSQLRVSPPKLVIGAGHAPMAEILRFL